MLLAFRSEIEELELFLWPVNKVKPTNRTEVWTKILTSKDEEFMSNPQITEFRNRLNKITMTPDFFIKRCVLLFYEKSSTLDGHKVKFPKRSLVSNAIIVNVLDKMGLPTDDVYVSAVEILLRPITSVK